MKVHTVTKTHPNQSIADGALQQFTKPPIHNEGRDARMMGNVLAQETIALVRTQDTKWQDIAWQIIGLPTDGREAYIKALDKQLEAMREDVQTFHGYDDKTTKKTVATATVRVSQCRTIAKGFNAGGSIEGLQAFYNIDDPKGLGFNMLYQYAQTFSKSVAGRKADTLLVKLGKWIEVQKKQSTEPNAEDQKVMQELINLHNRLVG
jgi:hypothetical protein